MNVHQIVVFFVDHDDIGARGASSLIEGARFPNHCMSLSIRSVETRDIGKWHDGHPLNFDATAETELRRLFGTPETVRNELMDIETELMPGDGESLLDVARRVAADSRRLHHFDDRRLYDQLSIVDGAWSAHAIRVSESDESPRWGIVVQRCSADLRESWIPAVRGKSKTYRPCPSEAMLFEALQDVRIMVSKKSERG